MEGVPQRMSETEIRPDELMAEQARRHRSDIGRLVAQRHRFVDVACPACGGPPGPVRFHKFDLDFPECPACGTVFMSPRPDPGLLSEYYATSENYAYWNEVVFPASEDARRAKIFVPRVERVVEIVQRLGGAGGTLLDVGAGFGIFCEEAARTGAFERVIALEPEPHLAATCRAKGVEVVEAPVERAELPVEAVDVVTSFEVIEHLFEPAAFVARCAELLRPGGLVVLTTPNVRGFDIQVLGAAASAVDAAHLNLFHPASLAGLLERSGFDVVERSTPGRLDAEIVRKRVLDGQASLDGQRFLEQVILEEWERVGDAFQDFLAANGLSSNMWLVGRLRG